ncbi:hypothetical protein [uncultured Acinetobacter sp.]|uniref:hypothetical protein n=1 Tax=uncultured Acinetobacter sp. TaxID=165433 RepID=UPI00258A9140|nr:hypothetical protein [uncultured Acinetobacter sp.]
MTTINNLTKHDSPEFKVGDLVLTIDPWFGKTLLKITGFAMVAEKNALFECGGFFRVSALRHATPEEIKAGHRIDDTTDHVTDIRNHVSPSTKVIDHG